MADRKALTIEQLEDAVIDQLEITKLCLASINPCSAEVKNPAVRKLKSMHLAI